MTGESRTPIAQRTTLDLLQPAAADALVRAVQSAVSVGAILPCGSTPDAVFRHAVACAIDAVEARGDLLRRFLWLGPYEGDGPIPSRLVGERLPDEHCNRAIALIYSHAINAFKGQLAEVLALVSFIKLIVRLQSEGCFPRSAAIFVGDSAMPHRRGAGVVKGADLHVLDESKAEPALLAVGEVKSYSASHRRLKPQLEAHVRRAVGGLRLAESAGASRDVRPCRTSTGTVFFSASPSTWRLSRLFRFVERNGQTFLDTDRPASIPDDSILQADHAHWHVTLGWSQEALAAQAFSLTYWYMEELGRELYADASTSPWPEMAPEEAGANAAKQMLYYAIRRCTDPRSEQRAIALYNAYCFGYALGTSFKDAAGRRQMLWPEQLREILVTGETRDGFRFRS